LAKPNGLETHPFSQIVTRPHLKFDAVQRDRSGGTGPNIEKN
jgi:hypothetical protein